jgi:hypothetical protein
MWKHFYFQNEKLLCCNEEDIESRILDLTNEDLQRLKNLPSVKKYIQSLSETEINKNEFRVCLYYIYKNNLNIKLF